MLIKKKVVDFEKNLEKRILTQLRGLALQVF
jgi:hypothetical protein